MTMVKMIHRKIFYMNSIDSTKYAVISCLHHHYPSPPSIGNNYFHMLQKYFFRGDFSNSVNKYGLQHMNIWTVALSCSELLYFNVGW